MSRETPARPKTLRLVPPITETDPEDSYEARRALAQRYTEAVNTCVSVSSAIEATAAALALPPDARQAFAAALDREIQWPAILAWQVDALASRMTLTELEALVALVSAPAGLSAISKLAALNAEAAPVLATEFQRAVAAALKETLPADDGSASRAATDSPRPSA